MLFGRRPHRQYCSRRLRRLYKSTKFLHGRGRFAKKKMEPHTCTDAR
jgi:signal recognition particle subunit SRP68